jgi:serine-type D-Ala-D-Ala endopeptidase (penicillin-binding protein 7)
VRGRRARRVVGDRVRFVAIIIALGMIGTAQAQDVHSAPHHRHAKHHAAHHGQKATYRHGKHAARAVPPLPAVSASGDPNLLSQAALIVEQDSGRVLYSKNDSAVQPIASLTKLMTALVVLESGLPLDEQITITEDDVDTLRKTHSRLPIGTELSRADLLKLALMASENRAASALGRSYPGGLPAFVAQMNRHAQMLGLTSTRYADSSGLDSGNVSSARDLAVIAQTAYQHPIIRAYTTTPSMTVVLPNRARPLEFVNTNALVRQGEWDIGLSKTGYINESGRCLVMQARIKDRPLLMVLLDSVGRYTRIGDATRVRKWFEGREKILLGDAS